MKTGVAVFLTATTCSVLGLPVVFAVIIAIVTIEPTASDSIRKGMVRFPAALIGAGLAMAFTYWFGQVPLTYTLATLLTIFICIRCKLEAGALIATITAVAMISVTYDHYFLTFVERVGTTTIGLVISTLVNLFLLPARFSETIKKRNFQLFLDTGTLFKKRSNEIILERKSISKQCQKEYQRITGELAKTFQLCHYQREEWKYHRHSTAELRAFMFEKKRLEQLQQIHYYLGHIISVHSNNESYHNLELLLESIDSTEEGLKAAGSKISNKHLQNINELDKRFWETHNGQQPLEKKYHHHFTSETVLLFVILSIHDVLEELERVSRHQIHKAS